MLIRILDGARKKISTKKNLYVKVTKTMSQERNVDTDFMKAIESD